mgnify:CR=1 FL=1
MFILYFILASVVIPSSPLRDHCRHLHTSENSEQVLYRPRYGRHRTQHQHRQADPHRRQAAASGLLLLGRYCVRQHCNAAFAWFSLSGMKKHKGLVSFVLEAVEKLSFFEQPLDQNHAFDRMLKKNRVLRTHFFFPCIKTEVHAPGFYEFAAQILFYACCRTKSKNDRLTLSTD